MSDSDTANAKVLFRVENDDGSVEVETLWAIDLGNDSYRLDNSPFYAYSVSWRDIVCAPQDAAEGRPVFSHVVEKSGHRTIRILFELPWADGNSTDTALQGLIKFGCTYEGADRKLFALDVPPTVDLEAVRAYLVSIGVNWEHADPTYAAPFPSESEN